MIIELQKNENGNTQRNPLKKNALKKLEQARADVEFADGLKSQ